MIANSWRKNDKPCSSRALLFIENPNASWQSILEHGAFFPGESEFVMCQFSPFYYPKVKENKMKPWKHHVLTTHTVCKHCWLICYETDMGPEIPTAVADQNFAWIYKQHQDLIGSVLSFRTKIIWSRPEFGLVRCGYLNAAIICLFISTAELFHWLCGAIKQTAVKCGYIYGGTDWLNERKIKSYLIIWKPNQKGRSMHIAHLRLGLTSKGQTRSCQLDINHISLNQTHFRLFWKSESLQITKSSKWFNSFINNRN